MKHPAINLAWFSLFCLSLGGRAERVAACSCALVDSTQAAVSERFDAAEAVFFGMIVGQEPDFDPGHDPAWDEWPSRPINFLVIESWKGVTGQEVGVHTEAGGSFASCGLWGSLGERFLVYAHLDEETGQLRTSACSARRDYGHDAEYGAAVEIAVLQQLDIPPVAVADGPDPRFPPAQLPPNAETPDVDDPEEPLDLSLPPAPSKGAGQSNGPCGIGVDFGLIGALSTLTLLRWGRRRGRRLVQ